MSVLDRLDSLRRGSGLDLYNWIDGAAAQPAEDRWLENRAPATGQVIARIPASTASDVEAAIAAAKRAAPAFGRTSVAERADLLDRFAAALEARLQELAELESIDNGKPLSLALAIDIPRAVANLRFFAGAIRHESSDFHPMGSAFNYTLRQPVGVVGLITPWNLPLYLLTWKVAPALATGNAIVAKPSELTPLTATALGEISREVGVPDGVLNIVHGAGAEAGEAIVAHRDVRVISFTGGTATGARVAATSAPLFKKVSLELGGKNPTVVFADADFDKAVEGARKAAFTNQGEICLCGSRLFVEESIYDRFVPALVAATRAMRVGDPADPATNMGALVSAGHRDKVESYFDLALEEGGEILCGGRRPDLAAPFDSGYFLEPTVIAGLAPTCRTATEEIFGPIVTVHSFQTEEEAVAGANGVRYGLAGSVWTRDLSRAHRVAASIESGMIWVNTWLLRDLRVPFGGVKESGVGIEGGRHSLDVFSQLKNVCIQT